LNYSNTGHPHCQGETLRNLCITLPELQELEIIKRGIASIKNVDYLSEGLLSCKNLTSISVRHRQSIGDGFAEVIKRLFKGLKKIDLQYVSDKVCKEISYCYNLTELSIAGADISETTLNDIADYHL